MLWPIPTTKSSATLEIRYQFQCRFSTADKSTTWTYLTVQRAITGHNNLCPVCDTLKKRDQQSNQPRKTEHHIPYITPCIFNKTSRSAGDLFFRLSSGDVLENFKHEYDRLSKVALEAQGGYKARALEVIGAILLDRWGIWLKPLTLREAATYIRRGRFNCWPLARRELILSPPLGPVCTDIVTHINKTIGNQRSMTLNLLGHKWIDRFAEYLATEICLSLHHTPAWFCGLLTSMGLWTVGLNTATQTLYVVIDE